MKTPKELDEFVRSDAYLRHQAAAGALLGRALFNRDPTARQAALDVYAESQQEIGQKLCEGKEP